MTTLSGQGLHGARASRVSFARTTGPTRLIQRDAFATIDQLAAIEGARATVVANAARTIRVSTVEHLFAALAAERLYRGVEITIDGDEIPLIDGGARAFVDALRTLDVPPSPRELRVARASTIVVGDAEYVFSPGNDVAVSIEVELGDPRLLREASWHGDADDFRARIAPARTFGFAREVDALLEAGLASHVAPESVVVVRDDCILHAGAPFSPDEPARHKLLDLVGDAFLYGGPPAGSIRARRPGHRATHEAMQRALAEGVLVRVSRE